MTIRFGNRGDEMAKRICAVGLLALWVAVALWPAQARAFFCLSFGMGMGSGPVAGPPPWYGPPPGAPLFMPRPLPYVLSPGPQGRAATISAPADREAATPRAVPSVWEGLQDQDASDSGATF
jgi:hypothetical protein